MLLCILPTAAVHFLSAEICLDGSLEFPKGSLLGLGQDSGLAI